MRKSHWAIAVVAALGVTAFVAFQWAKSRGASEIQAAFQALRASGMTVTHSALDVAPWSRALTLDKLRIETQAAPKTIITIDRIAADGVAPSGAGATADRVVLRNVSIAAAETPDKPIVSLPEVTADGFAFVPRKPTGSADNIVRAVEAFAALSARSITAPRVDARLSFDMGQVDMGQVGLGKSAGPTLQSPLVVDYRYEGIRLSGVSDGRIERLSADRAKLSGHAPGPIDGMIEGLSAESVDMLPMFELGLDRRKSDNGFYRIQGATRMGAYTAKLPDGGEMRIGEITARDMWLDPTKSSYRSFMTLMSLIPADGKPPSEAASRRMLQAMAPLYEGARIGDMQMRDLSAKVPTPNGPTDFKLARASMTGLDRGKLGAFEIAGFEGMAPNARGKLEPVAIGLIALQGMDFAGFMRVASEFSGVKPQPPTDKVLRALLPLLEGIEVAGLKVNHEATGQPASIDRVKVTWGEFIAGIPTRGDMRFKFDMPLDPNDPRTAIAAAAGLTRIAVDVEMAGRFDRNQRTIVLSPMKADIAPVVALALDASLADVTESAFTGDSSRLAAELERVQIGPMRLSLTDKGFVALMQKVAGPEAAKMLALGLRQQAQAMSANGQAPNAERLIDAVERFLSATGRTLTLSTSTKNPTPVLSLFMVGSMAGPEAVLSGFNMQVDVK